MEASERASSGELDPAQVGNFRTYLERLLTLPVFASRRRGQLLRYLVEQKLAGNGGQVTEYGIALDVFERPASFDPRTEATVRAEMSRLRRSLTDHYEGPGAADPWHIVLPGRGYVPVLEPQDRLAVQPIPQPSDAPQPKPAPPPLDSGGAGNRGSDCGRHSHGPVLAAGVGGIRSVAVLPFANLTGDAHNEYLADGVTEQLTDALAQIPSLRVVARTSSFQFKGKNIDIREIGNRLGADAVVEGSLQYLNGKIRLTAQVNRSGNGYHILSRSIVGGMQELGRLESEIVPTLVAALRPGTAVASHRTPDARHTISICRRAHITARELAPHSTRRSHFSIRPSNTIRNTPTPTPDWPAPTPAPRSTSRPSPWNTRARPKPMPPSPSVWILPVPAPKPHADWSTA